MPGRKAEPNAHADLVGPDADNFHDYLGRNLSDGYRIAAMALDDATEAASLLRGATMSAWLAAGDPSDGSPTAAAADEAFLRRFDTDLQAAIRRRQAAEGLDVVILGPLEAAIVGLAPRLQIALACGLGPWAGATPFGGDRDATAGATAEAMGALETRLAASDAATPPAGDVETQLRALYETRDPGDPAPLPLRMRLQQDLREAEAAAAERARLTRASGWRFVFNAFMLLIVVSLVIALASVINLRSSPIASGDPTSDPASPLSITGVTVVQGAVDGVDVRVGATQRTLIMAFAASAMWHTSARQCQADVFGYVDWHGQTTWIGQQAGHADMIAGDPSSEGAYVAGLGQYCEAGQFSSSDGGSTWSAGALPGGAASEPSWLAFDPARAHLLLAYFPGTLYTSTDSGASWTSRTATVEPIAFDSTGDLVGWSAGIFYQSIDDGATWQPTGSGPADPPVTAGASSGGVLIGAKDGLWWYPSSSAPSQVRQGNVYSIATIGNDFVVVGSDANGHPWLGSVDASTPGISLATLPPDVAALQISGGDVAVNDGGAVVAFSGSTSAIAVASFAH